MIYDDDITIYIDKDNDGVIDAQGPRLKLKTYWVLDLLTNFNIDVI